MNEYTSRVLTFADALDICDVVESRSKMMQVSQTDVPQNSYREWLTNPKSDAFDEKAHVIVGTFNGDELVGVIVNKIWPDLPGIKIYSTTIFTKKTDKPQEKYDNGYGVVRTLVLNAGTLEMEERGFYIAYNVRSGHPTWLPVHMNAYSRLNDYEVTDLLTLEPNALPQIGFFRKYLIHRPYDIPLIFAIYQLPHDKQ